MTEQNIETIHRQKQGKISDKWASYLPYYDRLLFPLKNQPISLLEIGIQNGGSLETWCHYFESATHLIGCDINPKCELLHYDDPRVKVVVGNANQQATFNTILGLCSQFDIVIDDGSHTSIDILNSFVNYFPLLKPGGVYVVEDTHCLYFDDYGGGVLHEQSAYNFFKKLVDVTNFQFWQDQLSLNVWLRTFFPLSATPGFILEGWVEALEFRNSMITIHKAKQPGHNKLGQRIISGNTATVQSL